QFTVVLFVMLAALGVTSTLSIPRSEDPPLDFPTFTIVAVYPGASAGDLERLVVKQIEDTLHGLDDVRSISSRIRPGVARIEVEFEPNQDAEKKYDDVVREVNALRPGLPAELARLEIHKASTLDVNIVQVALVSAFASYHVLDSLAEELEDRLTAVPGVRTAERWGAPERQVEVALDLGRLAALRLPVAQVLGAIGGESADIPGGSVDAGRRSFSVRSSGGYERLDQVRATVVRGASGRLVRVGDVARVDWGYADSTYRARFNGRRAVFVTASQRAGTTVQAVAVISLAWTGFTLNQLTIVGMVIALGLLVDDSIVVVENITRFRRAGHSPTEAAILATRQISVAVLGATATLVFAFVPLLFLPGGPGRYI